MHKDSLWHRKKCLHHKNYLHNIRGMTTKAPICHAVELMGGPVRAAARLRVKNYQTVQHWCETGRVPPRYCPEIERETGGAVRCEQLDSTVDWAFLRGSGPAASEREAA